MEIHFKFTLTCFLSYLCALGAICGRRCLAIRIAGSSDNITTIMVNLRDPKKWKYEAVVFSGQTATVAISEQTEQPQTGHNDDSRLNGNTSAESAWLNNTEISTNNSFSGGDVSPVRNVAADFVHSAVEMALNKVNNNGVSILWCKFNLNLNYSRNIS